MTQNNSRFRKKASINFWPYILITAGFFLGIIVLVLLMDKVIMPAVVHDNEVIAVPDIYGKSFEDAKEILADNDLSYSIAAEQYSTEFRPKTVIKQSPKPGTTVKMGRRIFLTVSKGKETVEVPFLTGRTLRNASMLLMRQGLYLGDTLWDYSSTFLKDTIISQNIAPGSDVAYGDSIDVIVSKGSVNQVEVPQLISFLITDARILLASYGLEIGEIEYVTEDDTFQSGTIIDQNPKFPEMVEKGSKINIVVVSYR